MREFFLWQVRSLTVRLGLDIISALGDQLGDPRRDQSVESGGILLGRVISPKIVEITGFEFLRSEHRKGAIYDFGARERAQVVQRFRELARRPGLKPVGYFRTHRRPGLFLDQADFTLMTEALPGAPSVALAIRPDRPGPWNAGFFYWENGDIDRRRSELVFPFDETTLRVQGPIDREISRVTPPAQGFRLTDWKPDPRAPLSAASVAVAALAVVAIAAAGLHHWPAPQPQETPSRHAARGSARASGEVDANGPAPLTPLARSEPEPESEPPVEIAPKAITPPEPKPARVQTTEVSKPSPLAPPSPPPHPLPLAASEPVESAPPPVVAPHPVYRRTVEVAVTLEPKPPSEMRKVMGSVPLLGHLKPFRFDRGSNYHPAHPLHPIEPQVPSYMAENLSHELPVDVKVSVDKNGVVKDTEVLHGGGTGFGSLAADTAGAVAWDPARSGDRRIASDVILHYRFRPVSGN